MMHGEMWWMPLMMWGPLVLLLVLAGAVGYLWARNGETSAPVPPRPHSQAGTSFETEEPAAPVEPPESLGENERAIYELVSEADGEILQKDLPDATGLSKATVSRALDRLERRGLVQRVSHGMTNKLVLGDGTRS